MKRRFWLNESSVMFDPIDSAPYSLGDIRESDIQSDMLLIGSTALPLDRTRDLDIIAAWCEIYPDGKPKPKPQEPVKSEIDILKDTADYLSSIMDFLLIQIL